MSRPVAIAVRTAAVVLTALSTMAAPALADDGERPSAAAAAEQQDSLQQAPQQQNSQQQALQQRAVPPRSATSQSTPSQSMQSQSALQIPERDPLSPNPRTARMRRSATAVQQAVAAPDVAASANAPGVLRDARIRARISARLATAVLPRNVADRWRHRDGGYGWVGPVFWPFAADDIIGYALSGAAEQAAVWNYGLPDIDAGLFPPSTADDLTGYLRLLAQDDGGTASVREASAAPSAARSNANKSAGQTIAVRLCGDASRNIAGLPVDTVRTVIGADDRQAAVLEDVAIAAAQTGRMLAAACPDTLPLTAPARLAAMHRRLDAMLAGVDALQPALQDLDAVLSDGQKVKLAALVISPSAGEERQAPASEARAPKPPSCADNGAGAADWPQDVIDRQVTSGNAPKPTFEAIKAARAKAADVLKNACQPGMVGTASARLAAMGKRLEAMQQAITTVATALDEVYQRLDPVQAANFDAVGPATVPAIVAASAASASAAAQVAALPPRPAQGAQPAAQVVTQDASQQATPAEATSERASRARPVRVTRVGHRHRVRSARGLPGPVHMLGRMLFSFVR